MKFIPTTVALIMAGGLSQRMGTPLPKQFLPLYGEYEPHKHFSAIDSVLYHCIQTFANHPTITHIALVSHKDWCSQCEQIIATLNSDTPILPIITGGESRQQSVYNGLQALQDLSPDYVLIHDGARPYVSPALIDDVIDALHIGHDGVIPALPATDTLKSITGNTITATLHRDNIVHAQTPQGFTYNTIWTAHQQVYANPPEHTLTDDASVLSMVGGVVHWVQGDNTNIKITTPNHLKNTLSESTINTMTTPHKIPRIGQGYDVHQFTEGDHIILCGVKIPHNKAFAAHSDGDVAMHALTDAIYGALAQGDIGQHFPPSDDTWKNADSSIFLSHAVDLVTQQGGEMGNIDMTIICEYPKISPHTDTMRRRLADIMHMDIKNISVKATTSEKLGFTGRKEGIAATATAIIFMP